MVADRCLYPDRSLYRTASRTLAMAPYDFDAPDTDAILRSLDGKELHVHKVILSLSSPVFQGMFDLPQLTDTPSQIPTIDVPETSGILQPFIQYLYPRSPPKIVDISMCISKPSRSLFHFSGAFPQLSTFRSTFLLSRFFRVFSNSLFPT